MDRRKFIQKSILTSSFLSLASTNLHTIFAKSSEIPILKNIPIFKLTQAPQLSDFKETVGNDPIAQLVYIASQGFTAFEDSEMRNRPIAQQEAMAAIMKNHGLTMGAFIAHKIYWTVPSLTSEKQVYHNQFLTDIKHAVTIAKRVCAKWITVIPGYMDSQLDINRQTKNVIETLKQASAILEPHGIVMILEPFNFRNPSRLFLDSPAQAYQVCKAVNSPSCKILFTIFHQETQAQNLISTIDTYWDEIAYFQVGDTSHNNYISNDSNYNKVLRHIHSRNFNGVLGTGYSTAMISTKENNM